MNILLTRKAMMARIKKLEEEELSHQYWLAQAYEKIRDLEASAADFETIKTRISAYCDSQERWLRDIYEAIAGKPYGHRHINDAAVMYMIARIKRSYKYD